MVALRSSCPSRATTTPTQPCSTDLYRCLNRRLGAHLGYLMVRETGSLPESKVAYKLLGTKVRLFCPKRVLRLLLKQDCTHNRQHHSCCLHKQRRIHEVRSTVCPVVENTAKVLQERGDPQGLTHSMPAECGSRQAISNVRSSKQNGLS